MSKNVLISVPNNNPKHVIYLPTIWANLKTYCDRSEKARATTRWLDPVIFKGEPSKLLEPYGDRSIDVLGLSCYSWNANTNLALAREVRRRHPGCLVLAGGPHIDHRRTDFFAEHPEVDAVVLRDGEVPFLRALEQVIDGERRLGDIPGLALPPSSADRALGRRFRTTAPPVLVDTFEESPWLENAEYFEAMMARLRRDHPQRPIGIPWEFDRGCPYHCTFCDWGSNTNSRVRNIPLDRIRREADWVARNKIHVAFLTIANFGMMARDEEILDDLIEAKRRHGFPRVFIWNNAKNNVHRVVSMNAKAFAANLVDYHILSVQSLDVEVLAAMRRPEVDRRQLLQVIDLVRSKGIPCVAQLIFGAPADTLAKFLGSLTGLMELGVHDEYIAYPFDVLPNAPANDPEYREKWGIRTVTRKGAVNRRDPTQDSQDYSTLVVATKSSDERGFVDMYVQGRVIIALHNGGVTQLAARYLRAARGVSFHAFYDRLIDRLFLDPASRWHEPYQRCHDHIAAFIAPGGEQRVEPLPAEELPGFEYLFQVEEYLLLKVLLEPEAFLDDAFAVAREAFGDSAELPSLRSFQRAVLIDPSYDRRVGRQVVLSHDWPAYFAPAVIEEGEQPKPVRRSFTIDRTHSGSQGQYALDWFEGAASADEALRRWARTIIGKHYQRVQRAYFKGVGRVEPRAQARGLGEVLGGAA